MDEFILVYETSWNGWKAIMVSRETARQNANNGDNTSAFSLQLIRSAPWEWPLGEPVAVENEEELSESVSLCSDKIGTASWVHGHDDTNTVNITVLAD